MLYLPQSFVLLELKPVCAVHLAFRRQDQSLKLQFTLWVFDVGKDAAGWLSCTRKAADNCVSCLARPLVMSCWQNWNFPPSFQAVGADPAV